MVSVFKDYRSPVDGKMITDKTQHREHLKRHDLIEVGNEKITPTAKLDTSQHDIKTEIAQQLYNQGE